MVGIITTCHMSSDLGIKEKSYFLGLIQQGKK
jgi:hypothetical protein